MKEASMPIIRRKDVAPVSDSHYPDPHNEIGRYRAWPLSDAGGLTQFGAFIETLEPGAWSSQRHWHETEDEFIFVLEGQLTLVDDNGPQIMQPGDAATFKAGDANGHHLQNRTDRPVSYLVAGTRAKHDICHYSDIDMRYHRDEQGRRYTTREGTLIKQLEGKG
jgi:uncharacterized cupin superfamily protein